MSFTLLLLFGLYVVHSTWNRPLYHFDEFRTMDRTVRLVNTSDWTHIRANGRPHMQKPPLQYFWSAGLIRVGCPVNIGLKLPSVVFGLGTLAAVVLLATELFPSLPWVAPVSVLFCLSSRFFWELSSMAMLDSGYAFFIVVSVYAVSRAERDPRWWIWWGLASGLGAMQKVPVAVFASLWVYLMPRLRERKNLLSLAANRDFQKGLALALAPIGVWSLLQNWVDHVAYRRLYVSELLLRNTVGIGADWSLRPILNLGWLNWLALDSLSFWIVVGCVLSLCWKNGLLGKRRETLGIASFSLFFLGVLLVGGGPFYPRYLLTVSPLLASVLSGLLCGWRGSRQALVIAVLVFSLSSEPLGRLPYLGIERSAQNLVDASGAFPALLEEGCTPVFFETDRPWSAASAGAGLEIPILHYRLENPPDIPGDYVGLLESASLETAKQSLPPFEVLKTMAGYSYIRVRI